MDTTTNTENLYNWTSERDADSNESHLYQLAKIIAKRDLSELQAAIRQGLNVNTWYNANPDALKAMEQPWVYQRHTPQHLLQIDKNDRIQVLHLAVSFTWFDGMKELLKAGADVNSYDNRVSPHLHFTDTSYTPLMHACRHANLPSVKELLKYGADPSAKDPISESTPLSLAMTFFNFPIIELLLEQGAVLSEKDALMITLQDAVEVFINPLLKVPNAYLLGPEELEQKKEEMRVTALHLMKLLLSMGADPNMMQDESLPALHICAEGCRGDLRGLELLASYGANVNLFSRGGCYHQYSHLTPLLTAVKGDECLSTVRWLIQRGANVNQMVKRYDHGCSVGQPISILTIVLEEGLHEVASLLVRSGCEVTPENIEALNQLLSDLKSKVRSNDSYQVRHYRPQLGSSISNAEAMLDFIKQPQGLKWQVRRALRNKFGINNEKTITALPLPRILMDFLMCLDL